MKALVVIGLFFLVALTPLFYVALAVCAILLVAMPVWFVFYKVPHTILFGEIDRSYPDPYEVTNRRR